jgi:hypothetical protein
MGLAEGLGRPGLTALTLARCLVWLAGWLQDHWARAL